MQAEPLAVQTRHLARLVELFPDLGPVVDPVLASEPDAVPALIAFGNDYVGMVHGPARETQLRNLLTRLRSTLGSEAGRNAVTLEIARSDLRSGIPERAGALLHVGDESGTSRCATRCSGRSTRPTGPTARGPG
jgi:hypothetical protein